MTVGNLQLRVGKAIRKCLRHCAVLCLWILFHFSTEIFAHAASGHLASDLEMRASSNQTPAATSSDTGPAIRDIFDPCLGLHWQLRLDPRHPQGPRRMVLLNPNHGSPQAVAALQHRPIVSASGLPSEASTVRAAGLDSVPPSEDSASIAPLFVIRAGDRLTVDQDSALLRARLQATALEPAAVGQVLRVRLGTGKVPDLSAPVISVVALSAGAAKWSTAVGGGR